MLNKSMIEEVYLRDLLDKLNRGLATEKDYMDIIYYSEQVRVLKEKLKQEKKFAKQQSK
jgi:hypothetical protein